MSYWDYEEPYWEPSEADELFDELKSKLIDSAKTSIKSDMESLKSRNEYLESRNKELEKKAYEVEQKERDLQYKADNLRREVEKEFYKTAIEDVLKNALEESVLWFAHNTPHTKPKCNKCNENREWVLKWPNGEVSTKKCDCDTPDYWYEPQETHITMLKYKIRNSNYHLKDAIALKDLITLLNRATIMIIHIVILGFNLYMMNFVMTLSKSARNLVMISVLALKPKKSAKSIVTG